MESVGTIITLAILAIIVISFLFGFLRGRKKGLYKAAVDVGFVFVCLILSIFIARGITKGIANVDTFVSLLESLRGTLGAETTDSILQFVDKVKDDPGMINAILAIPAAIITPIVFIFVYAIFSLIVLIPKNILENFLFGKNKTPEHKTGNRWAGAAVGGVRNALVAIILLIPIVGYVGFIGDTLDTIVGESENAGGVEAVVDNVENDIVIDFVDDEMYDEEGEDPTESIKQLQSDLAFLLDNPMVKGINGMGGKLVFRTLTTKRVDGVKISVTREVDGFAKLYGNINVLSAEDATVDAQKASIENIKEIIHDGELVPFVASEFISFAAEQWLAGEEVFGYEKPNVGEEFQDSIDNLLLTLSTTDKDNIKTDIDTIANIYVICIEEGVIEEMNKEEGDLLSVFANENFVVKLFTEIYNNERTKPAIGFLANTVREYLVAVYDEVNGTTTPAPEKIDMNTISLEQAQNDAKVISKFIWNLNAFTASMENLDSSDPNAFITKADVTSLGAALDLLKSSVMLGDSYEFIVVAMLKSEAVADLGFVNQDLIDRIDDDNFSMKSTLSSTQKLAIVALSLNASDEKAPTKEESKEALKEMIKDMTPETAETLKNTVNEDVLQDFGMNEAEAGTMSNTINSIIDGMSSAATSDMTEEEVEREAEAVSTLVSVMNGISSNTDSNVNNVFGNDSEDSMTGMTADSLLETVVSSQVVTDAIVNAGRNEDDERVEDPFGVADSMTEDDRNAAEGAIRDYYQNNATGDTESDAALQETLDAFANALGMDASAWFN